MVVNIEDSARLNALISELGVSQKRLAESIGVSRAQINLLSKGERTLTENIVYKIARKYPFVNPTWLLTGEGDMFKPGETVKAPEPMDQEEIELRRQVDALKKEIARMANDLSRERDEKKDLLELLKKLTDKYG